MFKFAVEVTVWSLTLIFEVNFEVKVLCWSWSFMLKLKFQFVKFEGWGFNLEFEVKNSK